MYRLEKVLIPGVLGKELEPHVMQALQAEKDEIEDLFSRFELEPRAIRRALRQRIGTGSSYVHKEKEVHRSEACKAYFNRAEEIAKEKGSSEMRCLHLLVAILEKPGPIIEEVLKGFGVKAEEPEFFNRIDEIIVFNPLVWKK